MRTRELDRNNFGNDFWQDFSSVRANASPGHALPYYNHNYIPEKVVCELHFNVGRFFGDTSILILTKNQTMGEQ